MKECDILGGSKPTLAPPTYFQGVRTPPPTPRIYAPVCGGFAVKKLTTVLRENSVDIACITETFLNEAVPSEALDIPGYVIHRNDRKDGRRCGGVAVLVRQEVPCQRLTSLESIDMETLWTCGCCTDGPECLAVCHVIVGAVYNPPSADDKKMTTHILSTLDTVLREHLQAGIVVLGHLIDCAMQRSSDIR